MIVPARFRLDFGGVYNEAGQLQEDMQYTYEYDARGNRTKRSSKNGTVVETYAYNDLARLISYQKKRVNPSTLERIVETKVAYSYDPLGRRIQKDVDGEITQFAWLGQQLINESGSGASKSYQYGPQGYAPLSVNEADSALSVVSDHLSAPVALLNGQTESWTQARTPFGVDTLSNDNYSFNIGLPGQYYDGESGLKQNYFRDYDPRTGRYIQRDPIGLEGGVNTHAYALNNPLRLIDPTGEIAIILPIIPIVLTGTDIALGAGVICIISDCGSAAGEALGDYWYSNENADNDSDPENCPFPENPDSSPTDFSPIKGSKGKLNQNDGSIWDRDHSRHGGEQWKRWKNRKNHEKNPSKPDNSVWPDGRVRK